MADIRCLLIIAGFITASLGADHTIEVSIDIAEAIQGEVVTVKCAVSDYEQGMFINWWKKQESYETQLGTNNYVNEVFAATNRYSTDTKQEGDGVIFKLIIDGVQPGDAGEIGCSIPSVPNSKTYQPLAVIAPVQSVRFFLVESNATDADLIHEFTNGEKYGFKDGGEYYFRCIARGSNPAPTMKVTLGNGEDVSEQFEKTSSSDLVPGGQPGLLMMEHSATFRSESPVKITMLENSLSITCSAGVDRTEAVNMKIIPDLQFPPIVSCPKRIYEPMHTPNVKIPCSVRANPELLDWEWEYKIGRKQEVDLDYDGASEGHYSVRVEKGDFDDEIIVSLNIERLYLQTFRKYQFTAANALNETSIVIPVVRDQSREPESLSPSFIAAPCTILAALSIALLI